MASYNLYDVDDLNASQLQPEVYPLPGLDLSNSGLPGSTVLPTAIDPLACFATLEPFDLSRSESSLIFPEIGTIAAQQNKDSPFDYDSFDLNAGASFYFGASLPTEYGLGDDVSGTASPVPVSDNSNSSLESPELRTPITTINPAATIGNPYSAFMPSATLGDLANDLNAIFAGMQSSAESQEEASSPETGSSPKERFVRALPKRGARSQTTALSTTRASKQAARTKSSAHLKMEEAEETSNGRVKRGKKRAIEEEVEEEEEEEQVFRQKPKRSKRNWQSGDVVSGFACPYPKHSGSNLHCNVLLGSAHEVPRHLLKHLIEEEDDLRDHPEMDPSTLVFAGRRANRSRCPHCNVEFSRWDSYDRHIANRERNGWCSTPVGMHGKHALIDWFNTGGAAGVTAEIVVRGEKCFIVRIEHRHSYWTPDKYRFKSVGRGKVMHPEWRRTDQAPFRDEFTAYTLPTPYESNGQVEELELPPPYESKPSAEDSGPSAEDSST